MTRAEQSDRRHGPRARSDIAVRLHDGAFVTHARCIEVSPRGLLLDRGRPVDSTREPAYLRLELELESPRPTVAAIARPVWSRGPLQALRLSEVHDADRLELAEYLDQLRARPRSG